MQHRDVVPGDRDNYVVRIGIGRRILAVTFDQIIRRHPDRFGLPYRSLGKGPGKNDATEQEGDR